MPSNIIAFDIGTAQLKLAWFSGKTCRLTASAPVPESKLHTFLEKQHRFH